MCMCISIMIANSAAAPSKHEHLPPTPPNPQAHLVAPQPEERPAPPGKGVPHPLWCALLVQGVAVPRGGLVVRSRLSSSARRIDQVCLVGLISWVGLKGSTYITRVVPMIVSPFLAVLAARASGVAAAVHQKRFSTAPQHCELHHHTYITKNCTAEQLTRNATSSNIVIHRDPSTNCTPVVGSALSLRS